MWIVSNNLKNDKYEQILFKWVLSKIKCYKNDLFERIEQFIKNANKNKT